MLYLWCLQEANILGWEADSKQIKRSLQVEISTRKKTGQGNTVDRNWERHLSGGRE